MVETQYVVKFFFFLANNLKRWLTIVVKRSYTQLRLTGFHLKFPSTKTQFCKKKKKSSEWLELFQENCDDHFT